MIQDTCIMYYVLCIMYYVLGCIMHRCVNVCMCIMYHVSLYICNIYIYAIYQWIYNMCQIHQCVYIYVFSTPAVAISAQPVILESGICYVDLSNYTNEFCKPVQKNPTFAKSIYGCCKCWNLLCGFCNATMCFLWISIKYLQICWPCIAIKSNFIFKKKR